MRKNNRPWYLSESGKPTFLNGKHVSRKEFKEKEEKKINYDFTFLDDIGYNELKAYLKQYMFLNFGQWNGDVIDDAILRICQYAHNYDPEKSSKLTWCSTVLKNHYLQHITRGRRGTVYLDEIGYDGVDGVEEEEDEYLTKKKYVANLIHDELYFPFLNMLVIKHMTYAEISAHMGLNISTTKSKIRSERTYLKKLLKEYAN